MALKAKYKNLDDVPEKFHELFTEKDGEFVLTGIEGLKTQADVDEVKKHLTTERQAHKDTKAKMKSFGDVDPEKFEEDMAELEELRALKDAGGTGKLDEEKVEKLVEQRVARLKAPLERELAKTKKEKEDLAAQVGQLDGTLKKGKIETAIRKAAEAAKVQITALDDVTVIGSNVFELSEDGEVVTKDGVGVTPGVGPDVWFSDMKEKRPHWWPQSVGGGAQGGKGGGSGAENPWSRDNWNMTTQGEYIRKHGSDKAAQMAKAAGTTVGGSMPAAKAS